MDSSRKDAPKNRPLTVLITGFGPFPTAPFNPTQALVAALKRTRRPMLADVKIATHIFRTSYAAVDRDLPKLLAEHRLISRVGKKLKVLGRGEVGKALTVRAHKFSGKAAEKIAAAGGATEQL